ncbi:MAG: hypothetical protein WCX31_04685 [Salinivirgaceae bacterium]
MYVEQQTILDATNGGLEIIIHYYPQAREAHAGSRKEFKIRDERSASARLKQLPDKNWVVTDFGDDSTPRNGILVCMKEEGIEFREAIIMLAGRYNIGGLKPETHQSAFEKRDAKPDEEEGAYYYDIKDQLSVTDYREIFPNYDEKNKERFDGVLKKFRVHALKSFTQIKDRKALVTSSTENYPIFLIEHDGFQKIYQPCNPEKQYRFRYVGNRPKDYINGLVQLRKAYEAFRDEQIKEVKAEGKEEPANWEIKKLDSVIIASGERDSFNVASYGYHVIWLNSETASLLPKDFKEIKKYCNEVYALPDIDSTGRKAGLKLALQYLEIRIIWLPQKMLRFRDNRGKPRKDFKDFIELYPKIEDFNQLYRSAIPLQFWDISYSDKGVKYYFNNEQAYAFLSANGFYRIENKNEKEGFSFIKIEGNIVEIIRANRAKEFVLQFLRQNHHPVDLINLIHKTTQMSENQLAGIPKTEIDFTDFDAKTQFMFFENKTWEITPNKVIEHKITDVERYVWDEEVIKHKVVRQEPTFIATKTKDGFNIEVKSTESKFFSYLINASRIHWQIELETRLDLKTNNLEELTKYRIENKFKIDGPLLDEEEIKEQKQHLLNKIFAIGYLMHRYKDEARPWCVFAMDNRVSDIGESHGRTGKSFMFKFLKNFMKTVMLSGRNPKLTDNPHIYDRVNEYTKLIIVDDSNQYLNFNFFFGDLTGDMTVNPKNNQSYEINFEKSPKFCFSSNYTLRDIDPSTEARVLYTVFSDYYHEQTTNSDYRETRKIFDDFGKTLHRADYSEPEWNADINFLADCISFYLSVPSPNRVNPPMDNITRRNLRTIMGDTFKNWADIYFFKDTSGKPGASEQNSSAIDVEISRQEAMEDFLKSSGQRNWTTNKFSKSMQAWADYTEYVISLNPEHMKNSSGRISKYIDGKTTEMIYVQTKPWNPEDLTNERNTGTIEEPPF